MLGRKVLVTGSGPIGVLVAASARLAGAAEIVVTDLFDEALAIARRMGATDVITHSLSTRHSPRNWHQRADRFAGLQVPEPQRSVTASI